MRQLLRLNQVSLEERLPEDLASPPPTLLERDSLVPSLLRPLDPSLELSQQHLPDLSLVLRQRPSLVSLEV